MSENEKLEQASVEEEGTAAPEKPAKADIKKDAKPDKKKDAKPGIFSRAEEGRLAHRQADPQQHHHRHRLLHYRGHLHLAVRLAGQLRDQRPAGPVRQGLGCEMADNAKWYVAHTYSGYENTVAASIEKAVENRGMHELIHEVNIPMETVTEITDNGPKTVERKVFPGYVLVKMVMTDETWHLVRNVRGVTGFVGSGNKAIPLTDEEIAALGVEKREIVVGYQVGDSVKITDGALESFLGTVEEIDLDRSKVRVVVSMFGRETPVELELDQVEPVNR